MLNNLAIVLEANGFLDAAEMLYGQVIGIWAKVLGQDTRASRGPSAISRICTIGARVDKALEAYEVAITTIEHAQGADAAGVRRALYDSYSKLLDEMGRPAVPTRRANGPFRRKLNTARGWRTRHGSRDCRPQGIVTGRAGGSGRACATSLAPGRLRGRGQRHRSVRLAETAGEIRRATNAEIIRSGRRRHHPWPGRALQRLSRPDILITNAGGPPYKNFRELEREAMLTGVTWNMITPIELIQRTVDGMAERGWTDPQHHLGFGEDADLRP